MQYTHETELYLQEAQEDCSSCYVLRFAVLQTYDFKKERYGKFHQEKDNR